MNQTVTMAPSVYVGLAVSNRTTASLATASFDSRLPNHVSVKKKSLHREAGIRRQWAGILSFAVSRLLA